MTENQHYIPQFYQRFWTSETPGRVWALDKTHKSIRQKAISHSCSDSNTYEADLCNPNNVIDDCYNAFENKYSVKFKSVMGYRYVLTRFSYDQKTLIARLFGHFSARNPYNIYEDSRAAIVISMFTIGDTKNAIDDRYLKNAYALGQGSTIEDSPGDFEEELMTYNMQVLISDKPNIVYSDCIIEQLYNNSEFFFPLCPNMVAHFAGKIDDDDGLIRKITDEEYYRFLSYYASDDRVSYIYSNNENVLKGIINNVIGD